MDILPEDIENLILDYKLQLEISETRKKFKKSLEIINQYNHNIYISIFRNDAGILIGNISNRFCLRCHKFIVVNYYWKRGFQKKCTEKYHFCNCS